MDCVERRETRLHKVGLLFSFPKVVLTRGLRYLFIQVSDAAALPRPETLPGQVVSLSGPHVLRRSLPNLRFHVQWRIPPLPSANWKCGLYMHATVRTETLHRMLMSVLRQPQPQSQKPYVTWNGTNDINAITFHGLSSIRGGPPPLDKRYRIRSPEALSIRIDWSREGAHESVTHALSLHCRAALPQGVAPATKSAICCRISNQDRRDTVSGHGSEPILQMAKMTDELGGICS